MERRDSSGQSGPRWSFPETHLVPDGAHEPSKAQGTQRTIGGFSQPTAASADQRWLQPAASASKAHGKHHRRLQPTNGGSSQPSAASASGFIHQSTRDTPSAASASHSKKHNENQFGGFSPPFQNTMKTKTAASASQSNTQESLYLSIPLSLSMYLSLYHTIFLSRSCDVNQTRLKGQSDQSK